MRRHRRLACTCYLVVAACSRTGRPVAVTPEVATVYDPLAPEVSGAGESATQQGSRITVVSASLGENCGLPKGNETAALARACDGRRRCDRTFRDTAVPSQWKGSAGSPCRPELAVAWTCGDGARRELKSVRGESDEPRLRLGCGPTGAPLMPPSTFVRKSRPKPASSTDEIRGRVVDREGFGLPRRQVSLGGEAAITDSDGNFAFPHAPKTYDIKILDRSHWKVTAYLGLSTRAPILVHTAADSSIIVARFQASIGGLLSADRALPDGSDTPDVVRFLSPATSSDHVSRNDVTIEGKRYGPFTVRWSGSNTVTGLLVALVGGGDRAQPWTSAHLAAAPLSLTNGDSDSVDLRLAPIATGRIAGKVQLRPPEGPYGEAEKLTFSYVIPGWTDALDLGECQTTGDFDCLLPDLGALGGEYCMSVGGPQGEPRAIRCGGRIGMRDFSFPPQASPPDLKLSRPVTVEKAIGWTGEGRVFALDVGFSFAANAHVYTSGRSFSFDELAKLGAPFGQNDLRRTDDPQRADTLLIGDVTLSALLPYASVDQLASGSGPTVLGSSWQRAVATKKDVVVPAPFGETIPERIPFDPTSPDALRRCFSPEQARPVGTLRPSMVDARVSVRGILTWSEEWMCTLKGCDCCNQCSTGWMVIDADADGDGPGLRLQRSSDDSPLGFSRLSCAHPAPPRIEVVATGVLFPTHSEGPRRMYLLDGAELCVVRPGP